MKRQALVIGINRYPFLKDAKGQSQHLTTPDRDASAVAHLLERYGHFEVRRYPSKDVWEVDPEGLVKADNLKNEILRLFQPKVNVPETALLFFAGRGFRPPNMDGITEGFLGTSDVNPRKNKWGISLKWLGQVLQDSPIQQQIVWLDCSFSGELFNFTELAEPDKKRDRCFITATQEFEEANAVQDEHGFLSRALLESLDPTQQASGIVTSLTLTNSVNRQFGTETADRQFKAETTQRPICSNVGNPIVLTSTTGISNIRRKSEHRLQRLWRETEEWFCADDDDILMKHSPTKVSRYFSPDNSESDQAVLYRQSVENALGGTPLPNSWWQEESVYYLHESLKCLCGEFFSGQDRIVAGRRHISVGAAYLIALMAYQESWPNNVEPLTENVEHWIGRTRASNSWVFALQDAETARTSAMALYDLFLCLFQSRQLESEPQVISAFFEAPGNILRIEFTWRANEPAEDRRESLADWTYQILESKTIFIPQEAANTRNAILRLLGSMFVSKVGFMSPGVVYMTRNELVVASIE
ncbi:MAG: caspase family protein [Oscillatoria princeps RMCB-10]|jgi:hypothetical protein|nr:caspase family protein [Oscillatoria princeps RMCB-10]